MKINHTLASGTLAKTLEAASGTSNRTSPGVAKSHPDHLQLSNLSSHLSADVAHRSSAMVDLSAAVSGGSYHVDAEQVSRKLIEEHLAA